MLSLKDKFRMALCIMQESEPDIHGYAQLVRAEIKATNHCGTEFSATITAEDMELILSVLPVK
jgi:hypothetical protein